LSSIPGWPIGPTLVEADPSNDKSMEDQSSKPAAVETEPVPTGPVDPGRWTALIETACTRWVPDPRLQPACGEFLSLLVRATGADRGSILVVEPSSGLLSMVSAVGLPPDVMSRAATPRTGSISRWVIRERRGLILNGELQNPQFEASAPHDRIGSALSVPLLASYGPLGVLNLARFVPSQKFTEEDRATVERLAEPVADAIERHHRGLLAHEHLYHLMAASSGSASAQLPYGGSDIFKYQLGFANRSSRRIACGLADRVSHPDGTHSLLFADVAGFGPTAAAAAAFVQGLFVAGASARGSAAELTSEIAAAYLPRLGIRPSVAVWIGQLSPSGRLASCNAGMPPLFLVPADGSRVGRLHRGGPAIGAAVQARYEEELVRLLPGDTVVAVSDGVMLSREATAQALGDGELGEMLHTMRHQPLERLSEAVCEAALRQSGRPLPMDDLTVLALRSTPDN